MDLLPRNILPRLEEALADTPVVTLQGARQTGKSTLAELVSRAHGGQVFTMDDAEHRSAATTDPTAFVRSLGSGLVVIDEVQRCPELILPIKVSVDRDRRPGRFLLTGSADLLRVPGAEDSLAGRAETVPLWPLSQGEFDGRTDDLVARLLDTDRSLLRSWVTRTTRSDVIQRLCAGGFPEAAQREHQRRRAAWLDDFVARLVRRDAPAVTAASPAQLHAALKLIAANQAGEMTQARFARDLGVAQSTAKAYFERLEALFLVTAVPPWSRNLTARQVNRPKTLVSDSGLATRLAGLAPDDLLSPTGVNHLGGLLEGFVASELLRQRTWSRVDFSVHHYRESGGNEVDLVISLMGDATIGIEVKATSAPTQQHATGLTRFADRVGDAFAMGVVLHLGKRSWALTDRVVALPVAALWEL